MIYQENLLNPPPSGYTYWDFRSMMKFMAGKVADLKEVKSKDRRYFIRRVTDEVATGNPTLRDLARWYPQAAEILRKSREEESPIKYVNAQAQD